MEKFGHEVKVAEVEKAALRLDEQALDALADKIGEARCVLLGEASHGTHEYYTWRAKISQKLIEEKGFSFVAVEGDWPDCYRINRYIKDYDDAGGNAQKVLQAFNRWPTWMWANWEIVAFVEWLKKHNRGLPMDRCVGFYGLDVYSLWESLEAIIAYLKKVDPQALSVAQNALHCFEPYGEEGQSYGAATYWLPESCHEEVLAMLREIRRQVPHYNTDREVVFSTEQNALIAVHAEEYYRVMMRRGTASWNLRDKHMVETLTRLLDFHGPDSKAVVWEHNTHIGDARATDMASEGMVNVGQLVREQYPADQVYIVGFGSHHGSVIAGDEWGAPMREMSVPPGRPDSWEALLHLISFPNQLIFTQDLPESFSQNPLGHRAIGVVYRPEYESRGNYVPSVIPQRYDAFIFLDKTEALHPLHIKPDGHQIPETYPWRV